MGRLGARLARTLGDGPARAARADERAISHVALTMNQRLRQHMLRWLQPDRDLPTVDEVLRGKNVATPHGDAYVVDRPTPLTFNHGARRLDTLFSRALDGPYLARLMDDPRLLGFDPRQALFLDIEASGLEHGAGTYAFLIGLGYLDGDHFTVRQLFLTEPQHEPTILHLLVETLERLPYLVSFNGKSYDLTVLQTRLVINRIYSQRECDLKLRPHLDLLHLSKNLYRGLWENTKLQTLEREALGYERVDDIAGSVLPSLWYHYLRTGNPEPLGPIFEHNYFDVLSMVTLADRLLADSDAVGATDRDPRTLVNLAHLLLRRKEPARAYAALERTQAPLEASWRQRALHLAARAARQLGAHDDEAAALDTLVADFPTDRAALVRRAMFRERVEKRLEAALDDARRARELTADAAIERRVARLEHRIEVAARRSARRTPR